MYNYCMNYTPLPTTYSNHIPTSDPIEPEPMSTHSPYKKALATILIAMFLGIGTTYLYFRNAPSHGNNAQTAPVVTVIPSPLPTSEALKDLSSDELNTPETVLTCPADSIQVCESGVCHCSPSTEVSPTINPNETAITPDPSLFSCSAGTVKVCQNGDCECLASNQ